jgi:glucose-1-phosphate cytidylyltransferase
MKVIVLCGGLGTRLSEETSIRPKPMVTIGDKPILWHIMNCYSSFGFQDFVLALGYKGEVIKNYFLNYHSISGDSIIDLATGQAKLIRPETPDWRISLIETGASTMTGGRLQRLKPLLAEEKTFMLTYGDGVSDVNISDLLKFHQSHGKIATLCAVRPPARFGRLILDDSLVTDFKEKAQGIEGWINGGFFVFERSIFDYLTDDHCVLEESPLQRLAADGQLEAFRHEGFWQCMDTLRDKHLLEELWQKQPAPWGLLKVKDQKWNYPLK